MFHPVGPQPPSVYWRRRLVLVASIVVVLVLVLLTVNAVRADSDAKQAGGQRPTTVTSSSSSTTSSTGSHSTASPSPTGTSATPSTSATKSSTSSTQHPKAAQGGSMSAAPPPVCTAKSLSLQAVPAKASYHVGDKPVLQLQVTNTAATPCVQDLADRQVELRVYNGESRVWGSHDCKVQPGTELRTLLPNTPVRVAVTWLGLSSEPKCAGTRQRVGAGTYTLYGLLAGHTGKAGQFSIS